MTVSEALYEHSNYVQDTVVFDMAVRMDSMSGAEFDQSHAAAGRTPFFHSHDIQTYVERAYAHLYNGDYDRAETNYKSAFALDRANTEVAALGRVLSLALHA